MIRFSSIFMILLLANSYGLPAALAQKKPNRVATYEDDVKPIFREHCFGCHNSDKKKGDLNLTSYQGVMAGGSVGEIVSPGNPGNSILNLVVTHAETPHMPPKKPRLPEAQLEIIQKWIGQGLLERIGGKVKKLRTVNFDLTPGTVGKPKGKPAMPTKLPATKLTRTKRAHPVTALASSPWAPLAAVSGHERVLLYHTETRELLGTLPFAERIPFVLKFSRNGNLLLGAGGRGGHSGKAVVWDVITGKRVAEIGDELDIVLAADISADHKFVALGGPAKLVKIFSAKDGKMIHKIKKHTDWVTAMEFSPDGTMLATGDRNGGVFVWETRTGGILYTLGDHKKMITDISWRPDAKLLATASEDGRVILWNMEDGFPARTINAHAPRQSSSKSKSRSRNYTRTLPGVLSVEYTHDGRIITTGRDKTVRIFSGSGSLQQVFEGFKDLPTTAVFSYNGKLAIAGDFEGNIRLWDVKSKKPAGLLSTNPKPSGE